MAESVNTPIAAQLAAMAERTTYSSLPEAVTRSMKERFLDSLGIQITSNAEGLGDGVADLAAEWGGKQQSGITGRPGKFPAPTAALVNGTLAHSLDFDDTHLPSVLHPSASVVPAALAAAEEVGAPASA